jgi:hypothetical protein
VGVHIIRHVVLTFPNMFQVCNNNNNNYYYYYYYCFRFRYLVDIGGTNPKPNKRNRILFGTKPTEEFFFPKNMEWGFYLSTLTKVVLELKN